MNPPHGNGRGPCFRWCLTDALLDAQIGAMSVVHERGLFLLSGGGASGNQATAMTPQRQYEAPRWGGKRSSCRCNRDGRRGSTTRTRAFRPKDEEEEESVQEEDGDNCAAAAIATVPSLFVCRIAWFLLVGVLRRDVRPAERINVTVASGLHL